MKKNNTWNIRHLVNESFIPATQCIILKIVGFLDLQIHKIEATLEYAIIETPYYTPEDKLPIFISLNTPLCYAKNPKKAFRVFVYWSRKFTC